MQLLKFALSAVLMGSILGVSACSKNDANSSNNNEITATTPVSGEASTLTERNAQQRFIKTLQANFDKAGLKAKIINVKATEIPNWFWVTLDGFPAVLASSDGKYIFQGDMIRLGESAIHNVSEDLQASDNKAEFAKLKKEDLIVYPAKGKTKHVVYVFTDSSCPYCHKLHEHMDEINSKGIEVRYIAWPRGEQFFPTMQSIWCSEDRKAAFSSAVAGLPVVAAECTNPVMAQYQLGSKIGVNGTPAIYSEDGRYLAGYIEPDALLQRLEETTSKK